MHMSDCWIRSGFLDDSARWQGEYSLECREGLSADTVWRGFARINWLMCRNYAEVTRWVISELGILWDRNTRMNCMRPDRRAGNALAHTY